MQLGSIKKSIRTLEDQIRELFTKWDKRPCADHGERMVRLESRLDAVERRVEQVERNIGERKIEGR